MDSLLGKMTSRQLQEWMEYGELEPWGGRQEDLRAAVAAIAGASFASREERERLLNLFPSLQDEPRLTQEGEEDDGPEVDR